MPQTALLIDIGSTFTKLTAIDITNCCILGTARSFTTVSTDVNTGLNNALNILYKQVGNIEFSHRFCSSSAAGGLKMVTIGLVPELTVTAAKLATENAGAKLIKAYSYKLSNREVDEIVKLNPDIILLTGGTNGGNSQTVLDNAKLLAALTKPQTIIYSGNKSCVDDVEKLFDGTPHNLSICDNVMPTLNNIDIASTQQQIRNLFLNRIIKAKGITKIQSLIDGIIMPTPSAVLKAATILSKGYKNIDGLGELMMVDVGGATTDVYSICETISVGSNVIYRGLKQPYEKRSVEGDLGARYSLNSVIDAVGTDEFAHICSLDTQQVDIIANKLYNNPETIAQSQSEKVFDLNIARCCVDKAVCRHAGTIEASYSPIGTVYVQTGKDLRKITKLIGTGGPIINSSDAKYILEGSLGNDDNQSLKPLSCQFYLDSQYIMAAMGLLSVNYPEQALKIMKSQLKIL